MSSFGERLRQQREMRGVSLDEIVATTKIGRRLLIALEEEQFDLLPGGIFNRSYVRAYAKCVGLDEEQAVAEYLEAAREAPPDTRVIAQQHASIHSDRAAERWSFPLLPALVVLAVAAGGIGGWRWYRNHQRGREQGKPLALAAPSSPAAANSSQHGQDDSALSVKENGRTSSSAAPLPSAQSLLPPASPTTAAQAARSAADAHATAPLTSSFAITVRAKDRAWVSIKADGQYVVRGLIKPPEVKTVRASQQVVFFTGNAGAVEVAFNGKNVSLARGANEEQVLVFDSRGLQPMAQAQGMTPAPAPHP